MMMELLTWLLTWQSTIISFLFFLFGSLMFGFGIWGRRESDIILSTVSNTPEERKKLINLLDNMLRYLSEEDIKYLCFALVV
jgi:hypothetical protein